MDKQHLITELQSNGLQVIAPSIGVAGRRGGAGPSDHKAVTVDGTTVMVPIYTGTASQSPYTAQVNQGRQAVLEKADQAVATVEFPRQPQFYQLQTAEGIPYWKIALLHSHDVLATTVLQTCMRYRDPDTACQFCAIEKSLEADRTIARKTPEQLAEVAEAAVRLDGVQHMIMTTGTPNTRDRGAAYLAECAQAIKARVNLPIQAQCEPPDGFGWFAQMKAAGIDSLGMHLEAVDPQVRSQIMPGKAEVPLSHYFEAFDAAVQVFGWGQVSTYLLAGLGDSLDTLVEASQRLIDLGVYPFVVPFVPISSTPLANHPAPSSEFMFTLYQQVGAMLKQAGMSSADINAGCAKCGACSALSTFEA
ncbi:MSMEG_0568 family radical SAM protein [Acaryochloris marina]|uniref:Radical SAM domain protein n=1 Tax=Acaryochloris marina (strain MBIC 11017) TaxID=329726 RepID=B0C0Y3_ACAM1|nr:MSMEG_0568 family radical SAM protein [Acaryochloris marina]ABW27242.1 radical SAM domain protein [Acaryochloris marina MBIC11017]BDM81990.1 radical SAM protein [Acaryochloris marina MBIC10699]